MRPHGNAVSTPANSVASTTDLGRCSAPLPANSCFATEMLCQEELFLCLAKLPGTFSRVPLPPLVVSENF